MWVTPSPHSHKLSIHICAPCYRNIQLEMERQPESSICHKPKSPYLSLSSHLSPSPLLIISIFL